jgi:hypothetical protein
MAYKNFTLEELKVDFGLQDRQALVVRRVSE